MTRQLLSTHNTLTGEAPVTLYDYQIDYLRGLPPKYLFAADTGTGKTFMALAHYDHHAYLKPLLIVAPASKANSGDWERDVQEYFSGRIMPEYMIVSYEKFSRKPSPQQYRAGKRGLYETWLADHPDNFAMICDEVHKAKNPGANAGRRVYEVGKRADFFVGLSATPMPNGWIDAANYLKIFGMVRHITEFKKRYCNVQNYKGFPEIIGYYHEDELKRYWNKIAKPLNKQAALDLPPITFVPVSLPITKEYHEVERKRVFGDRFLDNSSALLHALRQSLAAPKIAWLDDFLEGVSDNCVIFYNYASERDAILDMIKRKHKGRTVFRQDGEKHEIPNKPQWNDLERTITLAQYQSGSTGIELTYAATTIYFSPTYSYSDYEQSIGRTNRSGQTKKMTIYLLCAPQTVEREIWSALRNKTNFQTDQWYKAALEAGNIKE
jgi:SNF2 family DNA or RNA helicase